MSEPELKPCPFCGWANPVWFGERHTYDWIEYAAYCANCDARGAFASTKEKAATAWNRRVPEALPAPPEVTGAIQICLDACPMERAVELYSARLTVIKWLDSLGVYDDAPR